MKSMFSNWNFSDPYTSDAEEAEDEVEEEVTNEPIPRLANQFVQGRKICASKQCKKGSFI